MDKEISVIIVDDEKSLLGMLKKGFLSKGYQCETTTNGQTALELINTKSFDIMITDIKMPGIKGLELTEQARKIRPDMIIIIMTGFIDDFSYDNAISAGASDFIKKPFTFSELLVRIKHVTLQENLRTISVTDELTGLYNRRGFFTLVEQRLKLSIRRNKGIFMLYADMDNLKQINDSFGHKEGDLALIETARLFRENYRESDIIARIGGDEFVVIPVGNTQADADMRIARFQKALDAHNKSNAKEYTLSISIGISYFDPEAPCTIDELLVQAEKLMYVQKRAKQKA